MLWCNALSLCLNPFTVITVVYSCTPVDGPWPRFGLKDKPTRLAASNNREQRSSSKSCPIHQTSFTCTQTTPRGCSFHSGPQKQDTWGGVVRGKRHMAAEIKILVEIYVHAGCLRDGKTTYPIICPYIPQQKKSVQCCQQWQLVTWRDRDLVCIGGEECFQSSHKCSKLFHFRCPF